MMLVEENTRMFQEAKKWKKHKKRKEKVFWRKWIIAFALVYVSPVSLLLLETSLKKIRQSSSYSARKSSFLEVQQPSDLNSSLEGSFYYCYTIDTHVLFLVESWIGCLLAFCFLLIFMIRLGIFIVFDLSYWMFLAFSTFGFGCWPYCNLHVDGLLLEKHWSLCCTWNMSGCIILVFFGASKWLSDNQVS